MKVDETIKALIKHGINKSEAEGGLRESIKNHGSYTFMIGLRKRIVLNWIYNGDIKWNLRESNSQNVNDYLFTIFTFS